MDRINKELTQRCPGFEFVSSLATGPEQAQKILDGDKAAAIDGYLVYQMNCWNRVVQTMATSGVASAFRSPRMAVRETGS